MAMRKQRPNRGQMLRTTSAVAILTGILAASSAYAQTAAPPASPAPSAPKENSVGEVVVTATRIVRDGYMAPTPTSVIGAQEIAAKAPANLADFVNELPSMAPTNTP